MSVRLSLVNASRLLVAALALAACSAGSTGEPPQEGGAGEETTMVNEGEDDATPGKEATAGSTETATFGAGCFWCVEAVLEQLDGVIDVRSGYMGGEIQNPTYAQVCSGNSGHAEVVQLDYDPSRISYATLLDWFWRLHDPTTLNRQGGDFGTQYRSAVYYHSPEQRAAAEKSKQSTLIS